MNNPMNNVMIKIFEGADIHEIEQQWQNFAEQPTIEILDQSASVIRTPVGDFRFFAFLWFKWSKAGRD